MSLLTLVRFAGGGLRGHGLRTGLSILGVTIGVASVVLLTSLGEGARRFVVGEFTSLGSNLLIVIPGRTETTGMAPMVSRAPHDLTLLDARALTRLQGVERAAPAAVGTAPARFEDRRRNVTLLGVTADMQQVRGFTMAAGRFLPDGVTDAPVCVIGRTIQKELFGDRNPLGERIRIGDTGFRVIGVTASQGQRIGLNVDELVQVPVESALRLFDETSLFRILVEVRTSDQVDATRDRVLAELADRHGEKDVTVLTQDAMLSTFEQILVTLTVVLAGIAAISLVVAGVGIMNVMLVSVSERVREIGLLKALGVTRRQVVGVFLVEAMLISVGGGALGLAVGWLGAAVARALYPEFPMQPPLWAVAAAVGVSVTVGVVFGAVPARNAARLDPVQALMRQRT